jgi:hypothetical protein
MLDLIISWIVSTWFIAFVLGFYFVTEEFRDSAMTNFSVFNPLEQQIHSFSKVGNHLLLSVRQRFLATEVHHPRVAKLICKVVPACCPFEQDIQILGRTLFHVPALCKLNPFYNQLMELRFWALSYLTDECGEDITTIVKS